MKEVNTVVLENGLEYIELDEITYENTTYILLVNYKNVRDFCIRKVVVKDNQEYLCKLSDDKLHEKVNSLFVEKNKAFFN